MSVLQSLRDRANCGTSATARRGRANRAAPRVIGAGASIVARCAAGSGDAALDEVRAAIDNDLDTPSAVAAVDAASAAGRGVAAAAALLGVR